MEINHPEKSNREYWKETIQELNAFKAHIERASDDKHFQGELKNKLGEIHSTLSHDRELGVVSVVDKDLSLRSSLLDVLEKISVSLTKQGKDLQERASELPASIAGLIHKVRELERFLHQPIKEDDDIKPVEKTSESKDL